MENFREKYLIFQMAAGSPTPGPTKAPGVADVAAAKPKPGEVPPKPDETSVKPQEVRTEMGKLEEMKVKSDLEGFRKKMEGEFEGKFKEKVGPVLDELSLSGQDFQATLAGEPDFKSVGFRTSVEAQILALLNKKTSFDNTLAVLKGMTGEEVSVDDVKKVVAAMYANAAVKKAAYDFEADYPEYEKFLQTVSGKYDIKAKMVFDGLGFGKTEFINVEVFEADFNKPKVTQKTDEAEKPKTDDPVTARANALQKSFVGGFLCRRLSEIPPDASEGERAEIMQRSAKEGVEGSSPLYYLICLLGGTNLVSDGGAAFNEFLKSLQSSGLPGGVTNFLLSVSSKAPKLLANVKVEGVADAGKSVFTGTQFRALIDDPKAKIPDNGLKLGKDENFKLAKGEKLIIDLSQGGEVILGKGTKMVVNTKEEGKADENVIFTASNFPSKEMEIVSSQTATFDIPAGVSFNNKVKFRKEKIGA